MAISFMAGTSCEIASYKFGKNSDTIINQYITKKPDWVEREKEEEVRI